MDLERDRLLNVEGWRLLAQFGVGPPSSRYWTRITNPASQRRQHKRRWRKSHTQLSWPLYHNSQLPHLGIFVVQRDLGKAHMIPLLPVVAYLHAAPTCRCYPAYRCKRLQHYSSGGNKQTLISDQIPLTELSTCSLLYQRWKRVREHPVCNVLKSHLPASIGSCV